MARRGDDWSSMMQTPEARLILNGVCAVMTAFYAVDAVREMLSPERSAALVENIGPTAYYVITCIRFLVCAWAAIAFGRMAIKAFKAKGEDDS